MKKFQAYRAARALKTHRTWCSALLD